MAKIASRRFGWPLTPNQIDLSQMWVKQNLEDGDILHIQVGLTAKEMGGLDPWIPSPEDLRDVFEHWVTIRPDGVKLVVTHLGVSATVVKP